VAVVRILGVDPGTQVVGFGLLELRQSAAAPSPAGVPLALRAANAMRLDRGGGLCVLDYGVLRLGDHRHRVADRLRALSDQFRALLERLLPDELALEEAFYGKSIPAALRIGEARGVVLAEAARQELAIHEYAPARIKRCVTGRGDASKDTVAAMVRQQVALAPAAAKAPADATDALALALTRAEERRSPLLRGEQLAAALGEPARCWPRRGRRPRR
jgi:crossover junction endodeoxyribonuclease RuvC